MNEPPFLENLPKQAICLDVGSASKSMSSYSEPDNTSGRAQLQRETQAFNLSKSLAILQAIQNAASEGICLMDDSCAVVFLNQKFAEIWNLPSSFITGLNDGKLDPERQILPHVLSQLTDSREFTNKIKDLVECPTATTRDEINLKDGRTLERYSALAIASTGENFGRIWTFLDISHRKEYEKKLSQQAYQDEITGLPNRTCFSDYLLKALKRTERNGKHVAVMFLDLDRFKIVNDSLGHDMGDQLLIQVAERLNSSIRPGDTIARFGGDEFVVLLENVSDPKDATKVAGRIVANMRPPFLLDQHEVSVSCSIGIMLGNSSDNEPEDLLRKADIAMYRAKINGKAQYQVFSEVASVYTVDRLQLELDLHFALKRQQLEVYYQPIIHLETGKFNAWEALLRWKHPVRGVIPTVDFIQLAEETGQILSIGAYVLRVACEQARKWSDGGSRPYIHVNLSAKQFEQRDIVPLVKRVLNETALPPQQLMLEITETTMMSDAKKSLQKLNEFKKLGIGTAIDDFGTGYCSLAYIEDFPVDMIKIDRSFIWRLDKRDAVVRAVTSLGQALGLNVVAEGIESEPQRLRVQKLGCQYGQGYLFSEPLSATDANKMLQRYEARLKSHA